MRLLNLALATALPCTIRAAQAPFRIQSDLLWTDPSTPPDANATGHLIFDTVNALLQHWPNTRYRNGHNIVPGTVPAGTLLYHGRANDSVPTVPEWSSTDPEHAYHFCGGPPTNETRAGCWQLTFVVARPLKVLYFDGSSAANMKAGDGGTLDAQDLLVWGAVDPARWLDERARINGLCAWGREFGIEGYVRMEMDFEIMLCDFSAGVELLSADYLAAWRKRYITPPLWHPGPPAGPGAPTRRPPPPPTDDRTGDLLSFEMVRAGSWHNRYPGETRVALDLARLVSFYDTALAPSLIAYRAGLERWDHRVQNISTADLAAVRARLRAVLAADIDSSERSGVDWATLYRVVVDRYADRLELLQHLLNTTTASNAGDRARSVQAQLRVMLTPYILHAVHPTSAGDNVWAAPVWQSCATRHTAHFHATRGTGAGARLTEGEHVLLRALDETSREICRVVVRMWAAGVHAGLDPLLPREDDTRQGAPAEIELARVVAAWRADAQALVAWLDWSVWVRCRPACGVEEMCYLPTWPYFWGAQPGEEDGEPVWRRPQPRCIRVVEPYSPL
ncbi:hypothetical protein FB451DRAFT_1338595 [Mycena latifolia]|nr:hypothetical protein FB451DRAFT_1338595 [Mycena latifolia]